jgi:hypothetical protein
LHAAAQGLHGFAAAQGLHGFAAAQGLHGLHAAAAQGLQGLQGLQGEQAGMAQPATVRPTPTLTRTGMKVVESSRLRIDIARFLASFHYQSPKVEKRIDWTHPRAKLRCTTLTIM